MAWQALATDPLGIDADVAPARARAIADALVRRTVPLLVLHDGRAEPRASGVLFRIDGRVLLVTCRHLFERDDARPGERALGLGDLALPRSRGFGVLPLRHMASRVLAHPQRDLALIDLAPGRGRDELLQHWPAVPLSAEALDAGEAAGPGRAPVLYALAGWPYAQMRRIESIVYARPVVVLAPSADSGATAGAGDAVAGLRIRYARIARRIDGDGGIHVHSPELDGVSGATLWAVIDAALDGNEVDCLLQPAAVQSAFKPGAYARAEPLQAARWLLDRLRQPRG